MYKLLFSEKVVISAEAIPKAFGTEPLKILDSGLSLSLQVVSRETAGMTVNKHYFMDRYYSRIKWTPLM